MIANQAGAWLYDAHDWRFKMRPPASQNIVSAQTWIALPTDFGEMVGQPHAVSPYSFYVRMTTMADIAHLRRIGTANGVGFYAAISYLGVSAGAPPTPRLEIWPPQETSITGGLQVPYKAAWTNLTDDDSVVAVPPYAEALYLAAARAFAKGYEDEEQGTIDDRLGAIREGLLWRACELRNAGEQTDYGIGDNGPASDEEGQPPHIHYAPLTP